jgi:predicted lipid-binding transport protein (Tim44 family)
VALTKNTGYMRMSDALSRAGGAARSAGRALRSGGHRTVGLVHRVTGAKGADRTGLGTLIEMTAASGAADAFVTVALAGTIFFSTSVDQARGKVVLFLIITMAPFAVLAPFIGPALDRIQQGRRFVLAGTMLTRGLLCYAMSANVKDSVTLLPAAFGILVLQKAGGVVKASVTPRLLPPGLTLVTANARAGLISIITSTVAAGLAAGIQYTAGAAWTLRVGTVIYLASMVIALRLPEQIDLPAPETAASPAPAGQQPPTRPDMPRPDLPRPDLPRPAESPTAGPPWADPPQTLPLSPGELPDAGEGVKGRRRRWRRLVDVGPVVAEAMAVNAVLRAFSGYILFLLAFLLRSVDLGTVFGHPVSHNFALGALALGLSAGSLASMVLGSFFRSRAPQLIMFTVLIIAPVVTAVCAWGFGLWAAVVVEFTAIFCASLAKLAQDSIVMREIGDEIRSSTFSVSETLNQVANVAGGLAGVLVSILDNGQAGLAIAAGALAVALVLLVVRRRQRLRLSKGFAFTPPADPQPAANRLGRDVLGDGRQQLRDLPGFLRLRVLAAPVDVRDPVEQLHQVLDDRDHLVRLLVRVLGDGGDGRRRLKEPHLERLGALAALGDAELDPLPLRHGLRPGGQRGGMHEYLGTPVIAGEEAETLLGVIPLDLAGRHAQVLTSLETDSPAATIADEMCWAYIRLAAPRG